MSLKAANLQDPTSILSSIAPKRAVESAKDAATQTPWSLHKDIYVA